MSDTVQEAAAIYAKDHPGDSAAPNAKALGEAIAKGASAKQAADAAWSFYQRAEFADGSPFGSAYAAESLDHGNLSGSSQGFGYGMSDEEFNRNFKISTQLPSGETQEMREAASRPGLTWEQSLAIDPFLDYGYRARWEEAQSSKQTGLPSSAIARIAALEAAVRELQKGR